MMPMIMSCFCGHSTFDGDGAGAGLSMGTVCGMSYHLGLMQPIQCFSLMQFTKY